MSAVEYAENLEYDIVNEPWNIYELENKGKLRTRLIVTRIANVSSSAGKTKLSFKSNNVVDITPLKNVLGTPSEHPYSPQELADSVTEKDISFKITNEDWNIYKLKDGKELRIKLVLVKVAGTSKFDSKGEPIFLVDTQHIVKII